MMKNKNIYLIVISLIVFSLAVFGSIKDNDFINLDDPGYITQNHQIQSGIHADSIKWAFTTTYFSYWHPLTWLSLMLDWSIFQDHAGGYHLINLYLHIGTAIILFFFLYKTTRNIWPSAFASAFFALHPLRVESVAWACERKDILSMFFGMASIYAYASYAETCKFSKYIICFVLFAMSLMSKPLLATLPFVLLLLDYWPLGRWTKNNLSCCYNETDGLILEKVPFLILSIISSMVAMWSQNNVGAMISLEKLSLSTRIAHALISYLDYLEKIFWPAKLAVYYPYDYSVPFLKVLISGIILMAMTFAVLYYIKKLPFLFAGWFWYLGTLIPVIGLVQVGMQGMADRHTYLPFIGIAIILAWGVPFFMKSEATRKKVLFPAALAVLAILSFLTWRQCGYWKNSITLYEHTLKVTEDNCLISKNLGDALLAEGKAMESIKHYDKSISLEPYFVDAYNNRGSAYFRLGQYQPAIEDFTKAIRFSNDVNTHTYYNNRGSAYCKLGQYEPAMEDFTKAINGKPDYMEAYKNRMIACFTQGNNQYCCQDAQKICALGNCRWLEDAKRRGVCR